jgi:hypothetical protein
VGSADLRYLLAAYQSDYFPQDARTLFAQSDIARENPLLTDCCDSRAASLSLAQSDIVTPNEDELFPEAKGDETPKDEPVETDSFGKEAPETLLL